MVARVFEQKESRDCLAKAGLFCGPRYSSIQQHAAQLLEHSIQKSRPNPNFQKTLRKFDGRGGLASTPPVTAPSAHAKDTPRPLGWLQGGVSMLQYSCRGLKRLLLFLVEVKFDDGFDSAAAYDTGSTEGDITKSILTGHQG
jgi:hypothetical protein